jgi:hypothetical protein
MNLGLVGWLLGLVGLYTRRVKLEKMGEGNYFLNHCDINQAAHGSTQHHHFAPPPYRRETGVSTD